jgi:hypothetical protein
MLNKFNSAAKKLNRALPKINPKNLNDDLYLTGSLLNIDIPSTPSYESNVKSNPNPTKIINNTNTIYEFHNEILQFSARTAKKAIDSYSADGFGKLIINNVKLDYGTEGVSPDNFEVLVGGLHLPGDYSVSESGSSVVVSLNDLYIDFSGDVDVSNIYVIGKFINI